MAEAKKGAINKIKESILSVLESSLVDKMKDGAKGLLEELIHRIQDIAYQTEKKMIEKLIAALMMIVGVIFIILAITYFLTDFLRLQKYWSFLIVGLALIVIAFLLKIGTEKTKYYSFGGK